MTNLLRQTYLEIIISVKTMLNESMGTKERGYLHLGTDLSNTFLDVLFFAQCKPVHVWFPTFAFSSSLVTEQ